MVCDLDLLDAVLQRIDDTVRDKNLDVIKPPSTRTRSRSRSSPSGRTARSADRTARHAAPTRWRSACTRTPTPSAGSRAAWTDTDPRVLRVRLLTRGSPAAVTGGHLYHQRMAEAAPGHDATITFAQTRLGQAHAGACGRRGHRQPRGVAPRAVARHAPASRGRSSRWSTSNQAASTRRRCGTACSGRTDRFVYRRCDLVLTASRSLAEALVDEHGVDPARVRLVEPGCDLPPVACGRICDEDAVSPSSASPTGIRTRACSNCSTRSPRCPPATPRCTSPVVTTSMPTTAPGSRRRLAEPDLADVSSCTARSTARRSPSCTPAPTCSCCRATSRATRPCVAEALWAGCPSWDGGGRTSSVSPPTASRDLLVEPGDVAALSAALATAGH